MSYRVQVWVRGAVVLTGSRWEWCYEWVTHTIESTLAEAERERRALSARGVQTRIVGRDYETLV